MIWFKKRVLCFHCNEKKTRRDFENQPTCTPCRKTILMSREAIRNCVDDGTPMIKEAKGELVIDTCPRCGGVWLDAGEMEAIQQASQNEGIAFGMVVG